MREERKYGRSSANDGGGSVFKNAGENFVHRQPSNGRSTQAISQMSMGQGETTANSMISSPSYNRGGY